MAFTLSRAVLVAAAVLCLSAGAHAQNFTTSTPYQNLTAYKQAVSNFSGSVQEPSFPCGSSSSGLVGGYQTIDLDNQENVDDLNYVFNDVYNYFLIATTNLTDCALPSFPDAFNLSAACSQVSTAEVATVTKLINRLPSCLFTPTISLNCQLSSLPVSFVQVVSGTNYALEFEILYYCLDADFETQTETYAPLRTTVNVPIQDASFSTENEAYNGPVIKDIWFFDTPEVIAEASPEEASPEESAPESAPEAEAEAPASSAGVTLLSPGNSLDSGTTSFTLSPSTSSSSPAAGASPTPQIVSGFGEAAQNQSIISG